MTILEMMTGPRSSRAGLFVFHASKPWNSRVDRRNVVPMERKWWTLIAVCVATFILLLDITIVNVALPAIGRDLHASFTDLQWVVDAYTLTLAAVLLTAG